jgi:dTDP-4-dehydrorhamnose 3,5-epimerase
MKLSRTDLPGVLLIEPAVFADPRGFFQETWSARAFAEAGLDLRFVQDNHSRSARHVLRGLHFQIGSPQGKLVRVVGGAAFDVAVDIRPTSPMRGRWTGHLLSAENRRMLWIPPGFAHGFLSLADDTDLLYKCTTAYSPGDERIVAWNDPEIGIRWPLNGARPLLSAKDAAAGLLRDQPGFDGTHKASTTAVLAREATATHGGESVLHG